MNAFFENEFKRTSGDGMEQEPATKSEIQSIDIIKLEQPKSAAKQIQINTVNETKKPKHIPGEISIYRPEKHQPGTLPPVIPKGKLFAVIPRKVSRKENLEVRPNRQPRFVPFEPYQGAITPMAPMKHRKLLRPNRNQLDINILINQMSTMKSTEFQSRDKIVENESNEKTEFEKEREMLRKEIDDLKKQQDHVTAQLKFQVQVNSELKNLLVAAVGEDMQTRVNVLTEDKLQLARALLDTANNLSTHTEQIEYLAGQSEVWRSKFLASSVMIEELARWKADLLHKNSLLTKSNKELLALVSQTREMIIEILKNLVFLARMRTLNVPTSNISDLTAECLNILQQLVLHSGIGMPENLTLNSLDNLTDAEKMTIQALQSSSQPLMSTDAIFKAIVEQAFHPKSAYRTESTTSSNNSTERN